MDLWEGALLDPQYEGLSAEAVYSRLPADPEGNPQPEPEPDADEGEEQADEGDEETDEDAPGDVPAPGDNEAEGDGDGASDPGGEGAGAGQGQPSAEPGEVRDCPRSEDATPDQTQAEWEQAVVQAAAMAEARGDVPAGMERVVDVIRKPDCTDLIAALREFVARSITGRRHPLVPSWYRLD